jgi:hypothetical protein
LHMHQQGDGRASRPEIAELRVALQRAIVESDPVEQLLEVAAVITAAMAEFGVEPVVVGGLAVTYWSGGRFITTDIDFLLPRLPNIEERVQELGFVRKGRYWEYPGSEVAFEIPDQQLEPGDESERIRTKSGGHVRVITLEDMVLWRVREFLHWEAVRGFHQALYLLGNPRLDRVRLERRAVEEGLADALAETWKAKERIERGETIESYEIHDLAKALNKRV